MQATEAIKLIIGIGRPLIGRRLLFDALEMTFKEFKVQKDPNCPVCSENPTVTELIDYQQFCGIPQQAAADAEEAAATKVAEMTALEFKERLDAGTAPFLLDVRETEVITGSPELRVETAGMLQSHDGVIELS